MLKKETSVLIQAKDLRIGNALSLDNTGDPIAITADHIFHWDKYRDLLFPLKLTAELLINIGCEKLINGWYKIGKLRYGVVSKQIFLEHSSKQLFLDVKVEYMHQFQNLYFALTGKELRINEDRSVDNEPLVKVKIQQQESNLNIHMSKK